MSNIDGRSSATLNAELEHGAKNWIPVFAEAVLSFQV